MEKGLFIGTDGTVEWREFEIGNSYEVLRNAVDGLIECVRIEKEIDLWVNEEGKIIGLEPNRVATMLFWSAFGIGTDIIMGNVFLTSSNSEGETIGLTTEQSRYLADFAGLPLPT